mgnify:CR=1 FL=1
MATSQSRLSYSDCYEVLDKAIANQKGIRVQVDDFGAGNNYRLRLHQARAIDRKDNRETFPEGHKLHGRSVYDQLVVRIKEIKGKWWMYLERFSTANLNIEPLGEEYVIDETPNSNLREVSGAGESPPRSQAVEAEIGIFDGEQEKKEVVPPASNWRRLPA